ncbi:MAG: transposase [Solobacterium sp.]|nr:transposase [Solobacterium sp.]
MNSAALASSSWVVTTFSLRIKQMDEKIEEISNRERYKEDVDRLCCFAGMSVHKSLCHIVETGDFDRFPKAPAYSAYLGEVPGESSSSTNVNRLGLPKRETVICGCWT